jgi:hypothetical protein
MFNNIKKLFRRNNEFIPLPLGYDPQVFNLVMTRAISPEQQTRVLRTAYHLTQLWNGGETARIPRIIVTVEVNYPHLERMADLEMFGDEWLAELATIMKLTSGSADGFVSQSEHFRQLLREAYENVKPD